MKVGEEFPPYVDPNANGKPHEPESEAKPARKAKRPARKRNAFHPFAVLNAFRDGGAKGLTPTERLVWFIIWSHVDATTGLARLSYQALEEKTGLGIRQAKRVVQALLERGYLRVVERGSAKRWACNVYRVFSAPSEPLSSVIGDSK